MTSARISIIRMKRYIICITLALLFCTGFASPVNAKAGNRINNFDIYIKVKEDGVLSVTQKIEYQFNTPKHGIYATIPQVYNMEMNGRKRTYHFPVRNVNVVGESFTTKSGNSFLIKIGNPEYTVDGIVDYEYSYDLITDDLNLEDHRQMLYYNLVGSGWEIPIQKVNFTLEFAKDFDEEPYFYDSNSLKGEAQENIAYEREGNIIHGVYEQTIQPGQAFTVLVNLPDDYYQFPYKMNWSFFLLVLLGLAPLVLLILYFKYGRDKPVIAVDNPYPPENMSSMLVEYVATGNVTNKGIASLFMYWSSKGYLEIVELDNGGVQLKKLKEISKDENFIEKGIFNGLFKGRRDIVESDQLPKAYVKEASRAEARVKNYFRGEQSLYDDGGIGKFKMRCGYVFAGLMGLFVATNALHYSYQRETFFTGLMIGAGAYLLTALFLSVFQDKLKLKSGKRIKPGTMLHGVWAMIAVVGVGVYLYIIWVDLIVIIVASISLLVCTILILRMNKRSSYGNKLFGDILGFREFILHGKKDQIKELVDKNPQYFYETLPYAYALGVSNVWIKQFENVQMVKPGWYSTSFSMENMMLLTTLNKSMDIIYTLMMEHKIEQKSSEGYHSHGSGGGGFSSSGSGGGGFSDGGFGGGGGGDW